MSEPLGTSFPMLKVHLIHMRLGSVGKSVPTRDDKIKQHLTLLIITCGCT